MERSEGDLPGKPRDGAEHERVASTYPHWPGCRGGGAGMSWSRSPGQFAIGLSMKNTSSSVSKTPDDGEGFEHPYSSSPERS